MEIYKKEKVVGAFFKATFGESVNLKLSDWSSELTEWWASEVSEFAEANCALKQNTCESNRIWLLTEFCDLFVLWRASKLLFMHSSTEIQALDEKNGYLFCPTPRYHNLDFKYVIDGCTNCMSDTVTLLKHLTKNAPSRKLITHYFIEFYNSSNENLLMDIVKFVDYMVNVDVTYS